MAGIAIIGMLEMLVRGVLIGILSSAPMGPVGVLTVQRSLLKGHKYGFITGMGAAFSDFVYALLTGIFMGFAMSFAESPWAVRWLRLLGSVVLFVLGMYFYVWKPAPAVKPSGKVGTLAHNMLTGFLLTGSNPLIVSSSWCSSPASASCPTVIPSIWWLATWGSSVGLYSGGTCSQRCSIA